MVFYSEARVDGLMRRVETPVQMTEDFTDRDDFLYYKHVHLGKRLKKFGPQDEKKRSPRPIEVSRCVYIVCVYIVCVYIVCVYIVCVYIVCVFILCVCLYCVCLYCVCLYCVCLYCVCLYCRYC